MSSAKHKRIVAVVVAIGALAGGAWLRNYFSTEAVIARAIVALARNAEREQLLSVASGISRRYSDPRGMSYESFLGGLHELFEAHHDLRVPISVRSVSVSGATAAVEVSFKLGATVNGAATSDWLIGSSLESARARLLLRSEPGGWKLETVEEVDVAGSRFQ